MHICEDAVKRLKAERKFFKGFFGKVSLMPHSCLAL
ncbi:NUMB [Cervus elaphus hippelaphus]|uniref:NUMB n=1 Tax=Cervus elaphus hippelaphus TaxID=46360 RepID=A0A212CVD9_CEREH|nr:NUMB [Cervus elaphus hippelaphus]